MAPAGSSDERVGPHPSYIEVAKPYLLQSTIENRLSELNMSEAKEDAVRLQGVAWIDNVRRSLQLPVRTFNTAVVYYHKFRLLHADTEYNWADASAAALFTACKIEDTLKKSREILCANWNLKLSPAEYLSPDDPRFDNHSKLIIGLERLMLESASFDFRNRYPQKLVVKLAKAARFSKQKEARTAWNLSIDMYRTFAPLKQTTATIAIACVELAARLHGLDGDKYVDKGPLAYKKWNTSRAEVMEALLDLLDLYTHHRASTSVGPLYSLEAFIDVRIRLNEEASATNIPRYALYVSEQKPSQSTNGTTATGAKSRNGFDPTSPLTLETPDTSSPGTAPTSAIGIRGQNGTVRFMLDAARARNERAEVEKYWKVEEEEYEVEIPSEPDRRREYIPASPMGQYHGKNGRSGDRFFGRGSDRARRGRGGRRSATSRSGLLDASEEPTGTEGLWINDKSNGIPGRTRVEPGLPRAEHNPNNAEHGKRDRRSGTPRKPEAPKQVNWPPERSNRMERGSDWGGHGRGGGWDDTTRRSETPNSNEEPLGIRRYLANGRQNDIQEPTRMCRDPRRGGRGRGTRRSPTPMGFERPRETKRPVGTERARGGMRGRDCDEFLGKHRIVRD